MNNINSVELKAGLYIIATPIGNLRDISLRALDTLNSADLIVCEDTRVTQKLLQAYGIKSKTQVYNDHSNQTQRQKIIETISSGKAVALVSDAGMPLVSDPGYKLVQDCMEDNIYVTSLPGANAVLTAIQLSSLPSDRFCFLGFLNSKTSKRTQELKQWENVEATLILYESSKRLLKTLEDCRAVLGNRKASVVREMTKLYEEVRSATLDELIAHYTESGAPKGEIVIVLQGSEGAVYSEEDVESMLVKALSDHSLKDASTIVAQATGLSRKKIYDIGLSLKG